MFIIKKFINKVCSNYNLSILAVYLLSVFYLVVYLLTDMSAGEYFLFLSAILCFFIAIWKNLHTIGYKLLPFKFLIVCVALFSYVYNFGGISNYKDISQMVITYSEPLEIGQVDRIKGIGSRNIYINQEHIHDDWVNEMKSRQGAIISNFNNIKRLDLSFDLDALNKYEIIDGLTSKQQSVNAVTTYFSISEWDEYINDFYNRSDITGPSAGLPLALQVHFKDKLLEFDGLIFATGEIDKEGNVTSVGATRQKVIGAALFGGTIFLCPEANIMEAIQTVEKMKLDINVYGVNTIEEAIEVVKSYTK